MPFLRMWVQCPRASNGLLPRRSNLVGYVRWDAQSDRLPPCQTIIPTAFRSQSGLPVNQPQSITFADVPKPKQFRSLSGGCAYLLDFVSFQSIAEKVVLGAIGLRRNSLTDAA